MPSVAHILDVTDGTVAVNLASGIAHLEEYVPQTPETEAKELSLGPLGDGGNLYGITRRNLTETARVIVRSTNTDDLRLWLNTLEDLFLRAELYQNHKAGSRVYAQIQIEGDAATYRSEILRGRVMLPAEALDGDWSQRHLMATVFWERRFYWENASETELPLKNSSVGSKQTGGVAVYNHDDSDSGHDNWVEIDGAAMGGVLPCPIRAELYDQYGLVDDFKKDVWMGHNIWSDPANFQHVLESESADYVRGTLSVADATCSNGYRSDISWSGLSDWAEMVRWKLEGTYLAKAKGRYFRVFLRFATYAERPDSDCQLRVRLATQTSPYEAIAEGPIIQGGLETTFYDMGVVQIPPWLMGRTDLARIYLSVFGLDDSGGDSWKLDCAFIMPLDGYRYFYPAFQPSLYRLETLIDDGVLETLYVDQEDTLKRATYEGYGSRPLLWPGKTQRLYFLMTDVVTGTIDHDISRRLVISLFYRQRRLTL